MRVGGYAYGSLALARISRAAADLFDELSQNFSRFADVLTEVSESCQLTGDTDILRLYEKWVRTGSSRTAAKLRQQGIMPVPVTTTLH